MKACRDAVHVLKACRDAVQISAAYKLAARVKFTEEMHIRLHECEREYFNVSIIFIYMLVEPESLLVLKTCRDA